MKKIFVIIALFLFTLATVNADGVCTGTADECNIVNFNSEVLCIEQDGCYWGLEGGDECIGTLDWRGDNCNDWRPNQCSSNSDCRANNCDCRENEDLCRNKPLTSCTLRGNQEFCEKGWGCSWIVDYFYCGGTARECNDYNNENECEDQQGCLWEGEEENPFDTLLIKLGEILDKLTEIAEQEPIIEVEPNITVELPDKECEWENLVHKVDFELYNDEFPNQMITKEKKFYLTPIGISYDDYKINKVYTILSGSNAFYLFVNDVFIFSSEYLPDNYEELYELDINLLNLEDTNKIGIQSTDHGFMRVKDIYLKMEVLPANC